MPHIYGVQSKASGGGEGGAPSGPAGGALAGEYPNPTIAGEAVKAEAIAAEAVTTAKIKLLAITAGLLAAEAVTTAKLKLEAVTAAVLGKEAVTTEKIKLLAVEAGQLGAESVEEAKIKNAAVTEAKLGTGSVVAAKIGSEAVETAKVKLLAITKGLLSASVQEELEPKVTEHAFAIPGEVKNETYPGFFIKLGTHEAKNLIGVEYELLEGTSVEFELQKANSGKSEAAAGIAGYKVTELKAEKSTKRVASSKALANEDRLTLKCTSATGAPKGGMITLFIESVK